MRKVFLLAFALFAWNILANAQESDERYIEVVLDQMSAFLRRIPEQADKKEKKERGRIPSQN